MCDIKWDDEFGDYEYNYSENKWQQPEPYPWSPLGGKSEVGRPPLVDTVAAYQNGLLDAVNKIRSLFHVLLAAEEYVLLNSYCWGFKQGCDLMRQDD